MTPSRFLIVKLGALGDTVMALSMIEAIYQRDPQAQVTWICGKSVESLLRLEPRIQELIVVDDRKLLRGGLGGALRQLIPLWAKLFLRKFDLVATGHADPRYRLLTWSCRAAVKRSFGVQAGRPWPLPGRYHANEYVRLITGDPSVSDFLAVFPSLKVELRRELKERLPRDKAWVVLAPGGAKNLMREDVLRRWPLDHYVGLAEKLIGRGFRVVLVGSETDQWAREAFSRLDVVDLIGQTDVPSLLGVLQGTALTITHDSGPMHLAILAGNPVIALFGPTQPHEKVPRNGSVRVLWGGENLACRPCYDGKDFAPCADNQCMRSISVEEVSIKAGEILGRS